MVGQASWPVCWSVVARASACDWTLAFWWGRPPGLRGSSRTRSSTSEARLAQASAQASAREGRAVGTDWRPGVRFGNTSRRSPRRDLLATLSTDRARPRQAAGAICAGGPQPTAPPVSVTGASRGPIPRLMARRLNFPDRDFSPAWPQVQRVARYSSDWPLIPIYPDS